MADVRQNVIFNLQGSGNLSDTLKRARTESEALRKSQTDPAATRSVQQQSQAIQQTSRSQAGLLAAVAATVAATRLLSQGQQQLSRVSTTLSKASFSPATLPGVRISGGGGLNQSLRMDTVLKRQQAEIDAATRRALLGRLTSEEQLEKGVLTTKIQRYGSIRGGLTRRVNAGEKKGEDVTEVRARRNQMERESAEFKARREQLEQIEQGAEGRFIENLQATYRQREESARLQSDVAKKEIQFLRRGRRVREDSDRNANQALRAEFALDRRERLAQGLRDEQAARAFARHSRSPAVQKQERNILDTNARGAAFGEQAQFNQGMTQRGHIDSDSNRNLQHQRARRSIIVTQTNDLKSQLLVEKSINQVRDSPQGKAALREQARLQSEIAKELKRGDFQKAIADQGHFGARLGIANQQLGRMQQGLSQLSGLATGVFVGGAAAVGSFVAAASPFAVEEFGRAWQDTSAVIGKDFIPVVRDATHLIRRIGDAWLDLSPATRGNIVEITKWTLLVSGATIVIPRIIGMIRTLTAGMIALRTAMMTTPWGLIAGLGGLAIGGYVAYKTDMFTNTSFSEKGDGQKEVVSELQQLRSELVDPGLPKFYRSEGAAARPIRIETMQSFRDRLQSDAFRYGTLVNYPQRQVEEQQVTNKLLREMRDRVEIGQGTTRQNMTEKMREEFGILGAAEFQRTMDTMPFGAMGGVNHPEVLEIARETAIRNIAASPQRMTDWEVISQITAAKSAREQARILGISPGQLTDWYPPVDYKTGLPPSIGGNVSDANLRKLDEIAGVLRTMKEVMEYSNSQGNTSTGRGNWFNWGNSP